MSNCCQDKTKDTKPVKKITFKDMVRNAFSLDTKATKTKVKGNSYCQENDQTKSAKACC